MSQGIQPIRRIQYRCIGTPRLSTATATARAWHTGMLLAVSSRKFKSTDSQSLVPATDTTDVQVTTQAETTVVRPNYERNQFFRNAHREYSPFIGKVITRKLDDSPYIPAVREYPSEAASCASKKEAQSMGRLQVAYDSIWGRFGARVEPYVETLNLLKKMTKQRDEMSMMAAMRIVLPKQWDLDIGNRKVEFLDSATGLVARIRLSADHQNPSAIILRGKTSVLAKAADELVKKVPSVEVFQLGEVAAYGYEVKRLWPVIEGAPDGGSTVPEDKPDNIWVHKEYETYWIDERYENTPKPVEWTSQNFEDYITTLVFGRLRPHLAGSLYTKDTDTDGVRIDLMLKAFEDPSARTHITPWVLKVALAFMAQRGGHRAAADKLLRSAEEWGMPMDTDVFNIMLECYASKMDVAFFHKVLLKMQSRYFHPNIRTWLLFLQLVQKESERRQIIVAMFDFGFFKDPATRRGIARSMASHDAYVAFKSGKKVDRFMVEQTARYGNDWFTTGSLNSILTEFFRFHDIHHHRFNDFHQLIEKQSEDGQKIDISTINLILRHCIPSNNWTAALWALSKTSEYGCEPDAETYDLIIALAIRSHSPSALGIAFFYGTLDRMLRVSARRRMHDIITRCTKIPFWKVHRPKIFAVRMGKHLQFAQKVRKENLIAGIEHVILKECDGFKPVKSLPFMLDVALRTMDGPFHKQLQQGKGEDAVVGDMAIRMRGKDHVGEPMRKTVHLDGCFIPGTMIKRWKKPREKCLDNVNDQVPS